MEQYLSNENSGDGGVCQANVSRSSSAEDLQLYNNSKLFVILRQNTSEEEIIREIKMCLENGADINAQNSRRNTMLHIAVKKNYQLFTQFLLTQDGIRRDVRNCSGLTASDQVEKSRSTTVQNEEILSDSHIDIDEGFVAPLSMKLNVDNCLKLSHKNYINSLRTLTKDIQSKREKVNMNPYPSAATLAQFALKVYSDSIFDRELQLPDGWRLLTTACNKGWSNGYAGAAYWNPAQQLVVIAHRGTVLKDTGSIYTNIKGILLNKYASRINSAITFTEKIASALNELNKVHNWRFRLSITGHSLGGWLAQVTAFTVKYLRLKNSVFTKILNIQEGFHAHAVVFDSPGCKSMLSKMKNDFDFRHDKSMSSRRLDITCFLSAPNRINCCNLHVGSVYRVMIDYSYMNNVEKTTVAYTAAVHRMEKILKALEDAPRIYEMRDWPLNGKRELTKLFTEAKHENNYHPDTGELQDCHYHFREFHGDSCSLSVFSEDELDLIDRWVALLKSNVKLTEIEKFASQFEFANLDDLFGKFVIDKEKQKIVCDTEDILHRVIRHVKQVMRWFPAEVMSAVKEQMALVPSAAESIYKAESLNYLNSLAESQVNFEDSIGLNDFLESCAQRILFVSTPDSGFEATRLRNVYNQIKLHFKMNIENHKYLGKKCQTFLEWGQLLKLEKILDFEGVLKSNASFDNLLVIEYKYRPEFTQQDTTLLKYLINNLKKSSDKKFILISSGQNNLFNHLNCLSSDLIVRKVNIRGVTFSDLTEEARLSLMQKKIIVLQGNILSLNDFIGFRSEVAPNALSVLNFLVDADKLKYIVTARNPRLNIGSELLNLCNLEVAHATANIDTSLEKVQNILLNFNGDITTHFVISGICEKMVRTGRWKELRNSGERIMTAELAEHGALLFKQMCHKKTNNIIYWLNATPGRVKWEQIYDRDFYIKRKFNCRVVIDLKIKRKLLQSKDDIFVFENIESKSVLVDFFGITKEDERNVFLKSETIKVSGNKRSDIIIESNGKPVHFLTVEESGLVWQHSVGSLDGLRSYAITDISHSVDEQGLCDRNHKVTIIADEPGMGKSTSLTSLSWLIDSSWVIRIDLKHFQTRIKNLPTELSVDSVAQFLRSDSGDSLEYGLLKYCLESETGKRIFVLFDGFDEIKEEYSGRIMRKCAQEKVIKLLKFLKDKTSSVIFVTTRKYPSKLLENELSVFATKFEKIGKRLQEEFLVKFWRSHFLLELERYGEAEETKLRQCAEWLFTAAEAVLGVNISHFTGIPLQMRMLAEISLQQAKLFVESSENTRDPINLYFDNIYDLYRIFIDKKYDIYLNEKCGLSAGLTKVNRAWLEEDLTEIHRILGFRQIFPDEKDNYLREKYEHDDIIEVNRVGLIQIDGDGNVEFINRTFAEYYTADLVIHWLQKTQDSHCRYPPAEETANLLTLLLVSKILLEGDNRIIRLFINEQLSKCRQLPTSENTMTISNLWLHRRKIFYNKLYQTALHIAVQEQNNCIIKFLLSGLTEGGARVSFVAARDMEGDTALYLAAKKNSRETIRTFLDILQNCPLETIRHIISATVFKILDESNLQYVNNLTEYFSSNEYASKLNTEWNSICEKVAQISPFLDAVWGDKLDTVEKQLEDREDRQLLLMATDIKGRTALHIAAIKNNRDMVRYLGKLLPAEIDVIDKEGKTPLQIAAMKGNIETVQQLIEFGANIKHRDMYGMSALAWSAKYGHLSTVEYLVDHDADLNDADRNSITPVQHAAKGGQLKVVEYLAKTGADIHIFDRYGMNPLSWAARAGHLPVVEFLLQRGVDIDSRDRYSMTVLQIAIKASRWKVAQCLIHRGANVNIADSTNGVTALQRALKAGKWDLVQELLAAGSEVNALDVRGKSPLQFAVKSKKWSIAKYMLQRGAIVTHIEEEEKEELLKSFITDSDKKTFYEIIRLGSVDLLAMFIRQLKSSNNSYIECLQESYIELKLKGVPLSLRMQIAVEFTILETPFFCLGSIETVQEVKSRSVPLEKVQSQIKTAIQYIDLLCTQYSTRDEDEEFIFIGRALAHGIHFLKHQLMGTYDTVPWEKILFCLVVFISRTIRQNPSDAIYKLVLDKNKILYHLITFSTSLCQIDLQENISSNREAKMKSVPTSDPLFLILHEDFTFIKTVYGLKRTLKYLNLALSADLREHGETGMLAIQRTMHVLNELLKESSDVSAYLHRALKNSKCLWDLLKHPYILAGKLCLKESHQKDFFYILQRDLRKAEAEIVLILRNRTLTAVAIFCDKIINSDNLKNVQNICRNFHDSDLIEIDNVLSSTVDIEMLRSLLKELEDELGYKSKEETEQLCKIKNILDLQECRVSRTSNVYNLSIFVKCVRHYDDLPKIKNACNICLIKMRSLMKSSCTRKIVPLLEDISSNFVSGRSNTKINDIRFRMFDVVSLEEARKEYEELEASSQLPDDTLNDVLSRVDNFLDSSEDRKKLRLEIDSIKKNYENKKNLISICNAKGNIDQFISILNEMNLKLKDELLENYKKLNFDACISQINATKTKYENFVSSLNKGQIFLYDAIEILFASLNLENQLKYKINEAIKNLKNDTMQQDYGKILNVLEKILNCNRDDVVQRMADNHKRVAVEKLIMDLTEILENNELHADNTFPDEYSADLVGSNLRYYLASGDPLVDILPFDLFTAIAFSAFKFIEKGKIIIQRKDILTGWTALLENMKFEENFTKFLSVVKNQNDMFNAAENNNIECVKKCISEGADIKGRDFLGRTGLHHSARGNNLETFAFFLEQHSGIQEKDRCHQTPIETAFTCGCIEIVKFLQERKHIDVHFDKNIADLLCLAAEHGQNNFIAEILRERLQLSLKKINHYKPLLCAIKNGHIEVIKTLLMFESNWDTLNNGVIPLHQATMYGYKEVVIKLLESGVEVNAVNENNWTALCIAAFNGLANIVRVLLDGGAYINALSHNGMTPLHIALQEREKNVASVLIQENADIHLKDNDGRTALHYAADGLECSVLELLHKGVNVNEMTVNQWTALHVAAENGHDRIVTALLSNKANIQSQTKEYKTALHLASRNGHGQVVDVLLRKGANVNGVTSYGRTALHMAALSGHTDVVSILLNKNAQINAFCNNKWTALHVAAFNGHPNVVRALLKKKIDVDATNIDGNTALNLAASNGHEDVVKILLEAGANVDSTNEDNCTVLHVAAQKGNCNVLQVLLRYNPNIFSLAKGNMTALHFASSSGKFEIVKALMSHIESGSFELEHRKMELINFKASTGQTSLHMAVENGHREVVILLLKKGARIDFLTEQNWSVLHLAARNGHKDIVEVLLENGIQVDLKTNKNATALHLAAREGNADVVGELLKRGADIMSKTNKKNTALHLAVLSGQKSAVEVLLKIAKEKGEEILNSFVNSRDVYDWTALHLAARNGDRASVSALLQNMAEIDLADKHGWTALHVAAKNGCEQVVTQLLEAGADVSAEIYDKATSLHLAASKGFESTIISILNFVKKNEPQKLKTLLNHVDKDNLTAMHLLIALNSKSEVVQSLLDNEVETSTPTDH